MGSNSLSGMPMHCAPSSDLRFAPATFSHEGRRGTVGQPHEPPSPLVGLRGGGVATNRSGGAIGADEWLGVRGRDACV